MSQQVIDVVTPWIAVPEAPSPEALQAIHDLQEANRLTIQQASESVAATVHDNIHSQVQQEVSTAVGTAVSQATQQLLSRAYPIGAYWWTADKTADPNSLFGGTWERVEGRFLWAGSQDETAGSTGGERTHTLTVDEMPSHQHYPPVAVTYGGNAAGQRTLFATNSAKWSEADSNNAVSPAGGSQPHNNMPPYIVAFCWKRTA